MLCLQASTLKFKSIWYSLLQAQNTGFIQKSIKPVDKYDKTTDEKKPKPASSISTSTCSTPTRSSNDDNEYRRKREKNNESVRKTRVKNRVKLQECAIRVQELRGENTKLVNKLDTLQTELHTLRSLFEHCFSLNKLNSLKIKPSDIPTSALYNIIMNNKSKLMEQPTQQNNDQFYIDQLKNSLQNLVNFDRGASATPTLLSDNNEASSFTGILDGWATSDENSSSMFSIGEMENAANYDHDYCIKRLKYDV